MRPWRVVDARGYRGLLKIGDGLGAKWRVMVTCGAAGSQSQSFRRTRGAFRAFRPGAAVAEGLRALPEEPLGGALEDGRLKADIFDGGSDAPSGAFTEGS